MAQNFLEHR